MVFPMPVFPECHALLGTRGRPSSPSAVLPRVQHSGKIGFPECPIFGTRGSVWHSGKFASLVVIPLCLLLQVCSIMYPPHPGTRGSVWHSGKFASLVVIPLCLLLQVCSIMYPPHPLVPWFIPQSIGAWLEAIHGSRGLTYMAMSLMSVLMHLTISFASPRPLDCRKSMAMGNLTHERWGWVDAATRHHKSYLVRLVGSVKGMDGEGRIGGPLQPRCFQFMVRKHGGVWVGTAWGGR
jgi:hypothetical protein